MNTSHGVGVMAAAAAAATGDENVYIREKVFTLSITCITCCITFTGNTAGKKMKTWFFVEFPEMQSNFPMSTEPQPWMQRCLY